MVLFVWGVFSSCLEGGDGLGERGQRYDIGGSWSGYDFISLANWELQWQK